MSLRVAVSLVVACVLSFAIASYAGAAVCGGTTTCNCNDSIGSSYTMTADLNCSGAGVNTSDALRIFNRSNVVLDCDGYNIIGGDVLGANGVAVDGGSSNITIKNCTVRDFDRGISVKDSTVVTLTNITSTSNLWYGIEVADTATAPDTTFVSLTDSFLVTNGDEGVHFSSKAGVVPEHEIIGNVVSDNNCEGIYIANLSGTLTPSKIYGVRILNNSVPTLKHADRFEAHISP